MIGSGYCATRNVKIVRVVKNVRQKYEYENGALRWRLRELSPDRSQRIPAMYHCYLQQWGPMGRQRLFHQKQTSNQSTGHHCELVDTWMIG